MFKALIERAAKIEIVFDFKSPKSSLGEYPDFVEIAEKFLSNHPKPHFADGDRIARILCLRRGQV